MLKDNIRKMITNPSKNTLAVWALQDQKDAMRKEYLDRKSSAAESSETAINYSFSSEIKVK